RFVDAFNAAAARGVDIHLIYDGFANLTVPATFYRQLCARIHVLRLPTVARSFWKGPLRHSGFNHSKILVIDDDVAFIGGFNIGSIYARHWRDTHLRSIGPGAWALRQTVARVWNDFHPANEQIACIPPTEWESKLRVSANLPIQLVYPIRAMYLNAFVRARKRIWLTTPYFIPDRQLLRSLRDASDRGVDVRVMVPQESNLILGDWLFRGFFEQMINSDVTVLLYTASMIHSKVATVDGEWSTVGTANIDRLSLSFNYETNVEIIDEDFAAEMEKVFDSDCADCVELGPEWLDRHRLTKLAERALVPMRPWLGSPDEAGFDTVLPAHSPFGAGTAGGPHVQPGRPGGSEGRMMPASKPSYRPAARSSLEWPGDRSATWEGRSGVKSPADSAVSTRAVVHTWSPPSSSMAMRSTVIRFGRSAIRGTPTSV